MTASLIRPPLQEDEFDGGATVDSSRGTRRLATILAQLAEGGGYAGEFATTDLPVSLADWEAEEFEAIPGKGVWAWDSTIDAPAFWDGTTWRGAGGGLEPAPVARLYSIGPVAAKGTNNVHALYDNTDAAFPGPFTNPDVPRNLRVTFSASWDGGDVTVVGTNQFDEAVSETFADAAGTTVVGAKIFKTVTSASKETPAGVAGNGASIGTGDLVGVPAELADTVGFLVVGTTPEAVTLNTTYDYFSPTTTPNATTYKLLANSNQF